MSVKLKKDLKPCPFCGGRAYMFHNPRLFPGFGSLPMIVCDDCGATVSFGGHESENETVECFNRRK